MQPIDEVQAEPSSGVIGETPVQPLATSNQPEATAIPALDGAANLGQAPIPNPIISPTAQLNSSPSVFGGASDIPLTTVNQAETSPTVFAGTTAIQTSPTAALSNPEQPQITGQLSGQISMYSTSPLGVAEFASESSSTKEFFKGVAIGIAILAVFGGLSFAAESDAANGYADHSITLNGADAVGSHIESGAGELNWEQVEFFDIWEETSNEQGYYSTRVNGGDWEDYSRGMIVFENYSGFRGEYQETVVGGWEAGNNTIWLDLDREISDNERWTVSIGEYTSDGDIFEVVFGILCLVVPIGGIIILVKTAQTNKPKAWGMVASVIGAPFVLVVGSILILVIFGF